MDPPAAGRGRRRACDQRMLQTLMIPVAMIVRIAILRVNVCLAVTRDSIPAKSQDRFSAPFPEPSVSVTPTALAQSVHPDPPE
jgi:hypothetical protein